jgi:hypothetical protein
LKTDDRAATSAVNMATVRVRTVMECAQAPSSQTRLRFTAGTKQRNVNIYRALQERRFESMKYKPIGCTIEDSQEQIAMLQW